MTVTITNDFHDTEAKVRVASLPANLSRSQIARVRRTLCGISGCTCGGYLSERGPQTVEIVPTSAEGDVCLYAMEA